MHDTELRRRVTSVGGARSGRDLCLDVWLIAGLAWSLDGAGISLGRQASDAAGPRLNLHLYKCDLVRVPLTPLLDTPVSLASPALPPSSCAHTAVLLSPSCRPAANLSERAPPVRHPILNST